MTLKNGDWNGRNKAPRDPSATKAGQPQAIKQGFFVGTDGLTRGQIKSSHEGALN